jgi:chromosome partitioning protein
VFSVGKIVAIANQKGGVGKTTTAQHLGAALGERGRRTLLIDLDKQHSLSDLLLLEAVQATMYDVLGDAAPGKVDMADVIVETFVPNLHLAPASDELVLSEETFGQRDLRELQLSKVLRDTRQRYDFIVIDTSPGLGHLLMNALVAADEVVIPLECAPLALRGFQLIMKTIRRARAVQEEFGPVKAYLRAIVPTIFHEGYIVDSEMLEALRNAPHPDYEGQLMPLVDPIPATTLFEQSTLVNNQKGRTQTIFEMASDHPGAQAYRSLAGAIDV